MGHRFLTLNTVVRVRQIEVTRDTARGPDESAVHTSAEARTFRETVDKAWPGARITWAFSWLALHDSRDSYHELRELVVSYQKKFGDEITFIPAAYFANMYNTREQVNRDLHDGLRRVSEIVGDGYRPKSVVAGFLSAENLRYLAEVEGIHVCQGKIWSQYAVDNGDGLDPGSNFDYAAKLTEIILLGVLAQRFNTRIEWDAKAGRIANHPELNAFVKEPARDGWRYGEDLWK